MAFFAILIFYLNSAATICCQYLIILSFFLEQAPASEIQDKISFIINNLSATNIEAKAKEFTDVLNEQYYQWFAQYMVMKRCEFSFIDWYETVVFAAAKCIIGVNLFLEASDLLSSSSNCFSLLLQSRRSLWHDWMKRTDFSVLLIICVLIYRASIETNFHDLYLKFLDKVNLKPLNKEIVQATYENCKVCIATICFISLNYNTIDAHTWSTLLLRFY